MVASEICSTKMDWVYYKHAHGTAEISKSLVIKLNAMFWSVIISLADHALLVCFLCKLSQASKNVSKILHLHSSRPRRIPYTTHTHTHTHSTALWPGLPGWAGKGKTNLDFTEARDSGWQRHQLGHMQVCTSLQTDNHANTTPLSFLQAGCPSCRPTNSVKALHTITCNNTVSYHAHKAPEQLLHSWKSTDFCLNCKSPGLSACEKSCQMGPVAPGVHQSSADNTHHHKPVISY